MILGIESSCDETAAAVWDPAAGVLRSNVIAEQTIHARFGGVVPELASRAHNSHISDTVAQALAEAGVALADLKGIAVANGPGLMGSLLVGLGFAKGLHLQTGAPLVGVDHIDAHLYATFIAGNPTYPFLALTVSGGHTRLTLVRGFLDHEILGSTRDDAAGEAFDKTGKLLGLGYPAGPTVDRLGADGNPDFVRFPRALWNEGYDFSFSGLKTAVLYHIENISEAERAAYLERHRADLCASVAQAVVDVLVHKFRKAAADTGAKTLVLAGGVSANSRLRAAVRAWARHDGLELHIPDPVLCTDNGGMIAVTGAMMLAAGRRDGLELEARAS